VTASLKVLRCSSLIGKSEGRQRHTGETHAEFLQGRAAGDRLSSLTDSNMKLPVMHAPEAATFMVTFASVARTQAAGLSVRLVR
jgi:hypothetical protein